jgi:hypothetical protein
MKYRTMAISRAYDRKQNRSIFSITGFTWFPLHRFLSVVWRKNVRPRRVNPAGAFRFEPVRRFAWVLRLGSRDTGLGCRPMISAILD